MHYFSSKLIFLRVLCVAAYFYLNADRDEKKTLQNYDMDAMVNWTKIDSAVDKLNQSEFAQRFSPNLVNIIIQLKDKVQTAQSLYLESTKKVYSWCSSELPKKLENLKSVKDASTPELIHLLKSTLHDGKEKFDLITDDVDQSIFRAKNDFGKIRSEVFKSFFKVGRERIEDDKLWQMFLDYYTQVDAVLGELLEEALFKLKRQDSRIKIIKAQLKKHIDFHRNKDHLYKIDKLRELLVRTGKFVSIACLEFSWPLQIR